MPDEGLGEVLIPAEPSLTATYVAKSWVEIKKTWSFAPYTRTDRPTEIIQEPVQADSARPGHFEAVLKVISTGGLSLLDREDKQPQP